MKKLIGLLVLLIILAVGSCSNDPANPPGIWQPDTSGNDDNGLWVLDGSVTYTDGELYARNTSTAPGDTAYATATLAEAKDFGHTTLVTFTWREEVTNGAEYIFLIGERFADMSELPYHEEGSDSIKAQVQFWLDFRASLLSRYEFKLPPSSHVRIINYRSVAED